MSEQHPITLLVGPREAVKQWFLNGGDPKRVLIHDPIIEQRLFPTEAPSVMTTLLDQMLQVENPLFLSVQSLVVMDVFWVIRIMQDDGIQPQCLLDVLGLPEDDEGNLAFARDALSRQYVTLAVHENGTTTDISSLDVGSEDELVSTWGGLMQFSSHVGDVLSKRSGNDY